MANIYGRSVIVLLLNNSGGGVIAGDVVINDTSANNAFTTTTSAATTAPVWIAQETIASAATGRVLIAGYAALVNVNASVTRGNYGATHTVAKQAAAAGTTRGAGTFCRFLIGGTTPTAYVYPTDLLGSSLTNPMTTTGDIIQSSDNSGTPARLAAPVAGKLLTGAGTGTVVAWGQGPLTTTGDLMIGATAGTPTRLAVGAANSVLVGGTTPAYVDANTYMPWQIDIVPSISDPSATTGTWGLTAAANENIQYPWLISTVSTAGVGIFFNSTLAQNDAISWDLMLGAGTWNFSAFVRKASSSGIITLNQDAVSQGTVDTYAASAAYAKVQITAWTVATSGKHTMQLKMATKNASASSYGLQMFGISFRRTA